MYSDLSVFISSIILCLIWYTIVELVFLRKLELNKIAEGILLLGVPAFIIIPSIIIFLGK